MQQKEPERCIAYEKQKVIGEACQAVQPPSINLTVTRDLVGYVKDLRDKRVDVEVNVQRRTTARTCDDRMSVIKEQGSAKFIDRFSFATDLCNVDDDIDWSPDDPHFCRCWPGTMEEQDCGAEWTVEAEQALGNLEWSIKKAQILETQQFPEIYLKTFAGPSFFRLIRTDIEQIVKLCGDVDTLFDLTEANKKAYENMRPCGRQAVKLVVTLCKAVLCLYSADVMSAEYHTAYAAVFPKAGEDFGDALFEDVSEAFRQRPDFQKRNSQINKAAPNELEHKREYEELSQKLASKQPCTEDGSEALRDTVLRWQQWQGALKEESLDALANCIGDYIYSCHTELLKKPPNVEDVSSWTALSEVASQFQSHGKIGGK